MDTSLSLLILWLQLDWASSKQDVSQSPEALSVREGDSLVLNCSYTPQRSVLPSVVQAGSWERAHISVVNSGEPERASKWKNYSLIG
ncbi:hypothetical protein AB1E18_008156 [Capra hircus]